MATLPKLERKYIRTGRVAMVFKNFPLEAIHHSAMTAAIAGQCAAEQGQFWEMHDKLFADQALLDEERPATLASAMGLNMPTWRQCIAGRARNAIRLDIQAAKALGLSSTPSFLIGTLDPGGLQVRRVLVGAKPLEEFEDILDDLLLQRAEVGDGAM